VPPATRAPKTKALAEPVLKWAGGKRRLVEQYAKHFKAKFGAYHEPFFGGGAVYFWLWGTGRLAGKPASRLTDINPELINFYSVLQSRPAELFEQMGRHQELHSQEYYYEVRKQQPPELDEVSRAARMLYLNRTCFNGLYRENSRGEFNVPMGRYTNPRILHREGLQAATRALEGCHLSVSPYLEVENHAKPGDLVYFDPPYQPLTTTSNFTSYTQHNFSEDDQRQLAALFARLSKRKVKVLLSNSDAPLIRELYKGFKQVKIQAARAINSKADQRQKITELLILG
jgi:DNA adenine methylase